MIGAQIAHYRITAHLGSGGMGDVYQATDAKLGRSVAIKLLPETFLSDRDRVARFEREAHLLALLNHPNVAAIHGFEDVDQRKFLVMELVPGETLAERIARGAIPVDEAIAIAKQVAEALEAAHEKGVIHRDLKPANVKITPEGRVKVLDFGLARAAETDPANSSLANSPTMLSMAATNAGVILGTAAYMSPEQAKGRVVDHRTDIFAFGCVLYEMLSGKSPFEGEDVTDILGAVLRMEPDWTRLPKNLPPGVRNLLRLCLEKNPKNRRGSATDVRLDIDLVLKEPGVTVEKVAEPVQRPLWKRAIPTVASVTLALIAAIVTWYIKPDPVAAPMTRFSFTLPEDQQFTNTGRQVVSFAPDGKHVVYVANNRLYLKPMSSLSSNVIQGTEIAQGVLSPVFSPDSQSLMFYSNSDRTLKRIPVSGGAPQTIATIEPPNGMSWGEDDQILLSQSNKGIVRIPARGGKPETVISLQQNENAYTPRLLPDGDTVMFTLTGPGVRPDRWNKAQVVVQSLKSGERKILLEGGNDAHYLRSGHLVYAFSGNLMAVSFDATRLAVIGSPIRILEGIRLAAGNSGTSQISLSKDGSLVYAPPTDDVQRNTLALVDRNGNSKPLGFPAESYWHPRISPNGKHLAFHTDDGNEQTIWIYDLDGKTSLRQLTFGGINALPIWSPDSQRVIFQSDREGGLGIFSQRADGTGAVERLTKTDAEFYSHVPDSWAPNGESILFTSGKGIDSHIRLYSLRDRKETVFADAPLWQQSSTFSPDGRWVAYLSEEKGRNVLVEPFPQTGAKYQLRDPATHPLWSPDGKELIFMNDVVNGQLYSVDVRTQPSFAFGNPVALPIKGFFQRAGSWRDYDITPDGKQFIVIQPTTGSAKPSAPTIQVILNLATELQQRVPVTK